MNPIVNRLKKRIEINNIDGGTYILAEELDLLEEQWEMLEHVADRRTKPVDEVVITDCEIHKGTIDDFRMPPGVFAVEREARHDTMYRSDGVERTLPELPMTVIFVLAGGFLAGATIMYALLQHT